MLRMARNFLLLWLVIVGGWALAQVPGTGPMVPSAPGFGNISGDCTATAAGAITCTKTNGTSFAPSATTDTTSASNISAGTLPAGRISGSYTFTNAITTPTVVGSLPACNAGNEGMRAYVTDQNTAVAYRGAVTGSGSTRQAVLCSNTAWIQD